MPRIEIVGTCTSCYTNFREEHEDDLWFSVCGKCGDEVCEACGIEFRGNHYCTSCNPGKGLYLEGEL